MNKTKLTMNALAVFLFTLAIASAAQAAATRTFVDANGSDANVPNCTRALPCRTFQVAFNETLPGGEIVALSAAGYGGITTINKAITITGAPGMPLTYVPGGTTSFTVNGAAGDVIVLRNIQFNGRNEGTNTGVLHNSGKLVIEHCEFTHLTTGLRVTGGTVTAINSSFVSNSTRGIHTSGTGKVDSGNILVANNGTGITADGDCASTFVRVDSGSIVNNTLGIEMLNAGSCAAQSGSLKPNIFLRNDGGKRVNMIGNTTAVGPSPGPGLQAVAGSYSTIDITNYP